MSMPPAAGQITIVDLYSVGIVQEIETGDMINVKEISL